MSDTDKLQREAEHILNHAELLYSAEQVETALDEMAARINRELHDKNPVVLCLMIGAVIVTGRLLPRLRFPLQVQYLHASRYRGETSGSELKWTREPDTSIRDRSVLIIDDILDEGITLKSVIDECRRAGAKQTYTAVLVDKQINKPKQFSKVDFTGLSVPDKYVFGYGMDYKEYLRNCDGIYAVRSND